MLGAFPGPAVLAWGRGLLRASGRPTAGARFQYADPLAGCVYVDGGGNSVFYMDRDLTDCLVAPTTFPAGKDIREQQPKDFSQDQPLWQPIRDLLFWHWVEGFSGFPDGPMAWGPGPMRRLLHMLRLRRRAR